MSTPVVALRARVPRLAGAALERARLTVVPKRRRKSNQVPFLLVVSMLAVGGIVGLLLFNTSMQQASFAATSLQQQADGLVARQQALETQLSHLRDPQVIAMKAQHMGMVLPSSPAVLEFKTGKVLGDPLPATKLDPLRLQGPPVVKPAALKPPVHVTVVHAPTTGHHDSSTTSTRGNRTQARHAGRQGTGHHSSSPHH
jgi:cell division protein FtsB